MALNPWSAEGWNPQDQRSILAASKKWAITLASRAGSYVGALEPPKPKQEESNNGK
jgi:hypothetical protein